MAEFEHIRSDRIAGLIQQELGQMLVSELKDPRIGFVTVTQVRVTRDLKTARAFVSIYGTEQQQRDSLARLNAASGFLKREISHRLRLRHTPELTFVQDDTLERAQRLETLLTAVKRGVTETPPPQSADATIPVATDRSDMAHKILDFEQMPPPPAPKQRPPERRRSRLGSGASRGRTGSGRGGRKGRGEP